MTKKFIFSWCNEGIESIIDVTEYENWDKHNTFKLIKGETIERNPINSIVQRLIMRARYNTQRYYEIYMITCTDDLDKEVWIQQWQDEPQFTAELIRERGYKLHSDRQTKKALIT